ncbi:migration and invasion-inhibitory protein isoform X2 [Manis pentadactyla]|uniref:migration and invasion-inhibitory protein isoform X2 n=1 Tax=Manis pentadactyla TaxID=143292 RepID=UPI00255CECC1|nr:migration and invasion-inhibitory protein isoform X2 [Manis pentadactyla]
MVESEDLAQLRQLNLELMQQLWVGQKAVQQSVAKAASESSPDSNSSYDSEIPSSQEMSSVALRASCLPDAHQGDPCDVSWLGRASSRVISLSRGTCQYQKSLGSLRSTLDQRSMLSKRVTFSKEPPVPEESWRLRPYLGYDWIAGSLDNISPVTSKPEAFFSKLQKFREANKEECINSDPESQFLGLPGSSGVEWEHECVYSYRVNRRLFLVPSDPGTPCRLCRTPRDQRGPETLAEPAQVRVSVPLSVLDPPHRYHIHRRKSFDASDTLALPRLQMLACAGSVLLKPTFLGGALSPACPPLTWESWPGEGEAERTPSQMCVESAPDMCAERWTWITGLRFSASQGKTLLCPAFRNYCQTFPQSPWPATCAPCALQLWKPSLTRPPCWPSPSHVS